MSNNENTKNNAEQAALRKAVADASVETKPVKGKVDAREIKRTVGGETFIVVVEDGKNKV